MVEARVVETLVIAQEADDKMIKKAALLLLLLSGMLQAEMFDKGQSDVGVSIGAGSSLGNTYTIFGLNASYFVIDNLNVGLSYRGWFGSTPTQNELALSTNYFLPLNEKFHPYAGLFIKKTFISETSLTSERDFESYGARGGVAMVLNKNSYVSLGYAYEQGNCSGNIECSTSYPEVVFALSF